MELRRKLGTAAVMAIIACTSVAVISAGTASAKGGGGVGGVGGGVAGGVAGGGGGGGGLGGGGAGGGGLGGGGGAGGGGGLGGGGGGLGGGGGGGRAAVLDVTDNCGGTLNLQERVAGSLVIGVTEVSADPSEVWTLQATQQEYDGTTGGRVGAPIDLVPDLLPQLTFSAVDGFTTTATLDDTPNMTHGFSYVATRISPSPLTCSGEGFWTDHDGSTTPDPLNPAGRPDTAPAPTGTNVAHGGTNVVSLEFDQEMLATADGTSDPTRFAVTVDGVSRDVTAVAVQDDNPPNKALVSLTLAGDALPVGGAVTVEYREPLLASGPQLQDLDSLMVSNFGPLAITVS
jgi:Putative flagellar system-associated repeat